MTLSELAALAKQVDDELDHRHSPSCCGVTDPKDCDCGILEARRALRKLIWEWPERVTGTPSAYDLLNVGYSNAERDALLAVLEEIDG